MEPTRTVFQPLAEIEIDAVAPSNQGFTLTGQGAGMDRSEYRLDLHFELPLDNRTRTVLGELLSQSELTISRRAAGMQPRPLRPQRAPRAPRAPAPPRPPPVILDASAGLV